MTYAEQLEDPRWKTRRDEILVLDGFECQYCKKDYNLNVHHLYYVKGRMAWEYPDSALIVLCIDCHEIAHERIKARKQKRLNKPDDEKPKHISEVFMEALKNIKNA